MQEFFALTTDIGNAKLSNTLAGGTIDLTEVALGDGNGQIYNPAGTQTALTREVYRLPISLIKADQNNPSWRIIEAFIPADVGGWYIREAGIYDADGDMIAIVKVPESYKPAVGSGAGEDILLRLILQHTNVSSVTLKIDPSIVLATRSHVADTMATHAAAGNPHPQYATDADISTHAMSRDHPYATSSAEGLVELATSDETIAGQDATRAVTPSGLRARGLAFGGTVHVNGGVTLTAAHAGQWVSSNMSTGSTITLPDGTTLPTGAVVALRNWSAPVTVQPYGSVGAITVAGEVLSEYVLDGGRNLFLVHQGGGGWNAWGDGAIPLASGTRAGLVLRANSLDDDDSHYVPPSMLAQLDTVPTGTVLWHASLTPPSGYLVCDGALISRAVYAELYAVLSTTYGAGDGATTFALPDLRGEFVRGLDSGRGIDQGRVIGSWQKGTLVGVDTSVAAIWAASAAGTTDHTTGRQRVGADEIAVSDYAGASLVAANAGFIEPLSGSAEGTAGVTRPRNVALLPIIRY